MIYFDNSASTKNKPKEVIDAVVYALNNFGNSSRGGYEESLDAERTIFMTRKKLSKLFNSKSHRNIAFTKNASEALNTSIFGLIDKKDHIITTVTEHNSVYRPLNYLKTKGLEIDYIGIDKLGNVKIEEFENNIKSNTKAIIVNHASNVTGNILDIEQIGKICKKHKLLFIVDAAQTAGAFNIDVEKMNIDVLCFTGHKALLAPQGIGGICVKENVYIKPLMFGGTGIDSYNELQPDKMPTQLECGTLNSPAIAGLNASIDYILDKGMENITKKSIDLANYFYENIKNIKQIKIYGDFSKEKAPIVSVNLGDIYSGDIGKILSYDYNIAVRTGTHCAPLIHKAFNTVTQGMVRFSFSHSNSFKEVELAIDAIKKIIN